MQIQVNTDSPSSENRIRDVQSVVEGALERFGDRITRVEVHFSDQNSSQKSGDHDKRCLLEARVAGLQPVIVSDESSSQDQALDGALEKLEKTLKRTLGRLDDPKGRVSFAGDQTP